VQTSSQQLIGFAISAAAILAVFAFRMRRMMRSTPYNPDRALVYPAIMVALGAYFLFYARPQGMEWLWLALALVVGGGLGWLRAATVKMSVDPESGRLMAQGSAVAILFLIVLLIVRTGFRMVLSSNAAALGLRLVMADVIFFALAVGLLLARSLEMNLRGRRLLAVHRARPEVITSDAAGV
jgi:NAD/NADP transhydrogenase beta subunit